MNNENIKVKHSIIWYPDKLGTFVSKMNLEISVLGFGLMMLYAFVMFILTQYIPDLNTINGVNTLQYLAFIGMEGIVGIVFSITIILLKKYVKIPQIILNFMCIIDVIIMMTAYLIGLDHYLNGSVDKFRPFIMYGVFVMICINTTYLHPLFMCIYFMSVYFILYSRLNMIVEQAESKLCLIFIISAIVCYYMKAYSVKKRYAMSEALMKEKIKVEIAHKKLEGDYNKQLEINKEMQHNTVTKLADLIESRDGVTGQHTKRTSKYVNLIALSLVTHGYYKDELTDEFINNITELSVLHDVGKIHISDTILNAPRRLTNEEFEEIKKHTAYGAEIIGSVLYDDVGEEKDKIIASNIAKYHHEKWNGKGYPEGLSRTKIPLSARIMAVADVFDALVSKRCYKDAFSIEDAFDIVKDDAGEQFDPLIVECFLAIKDEITKVCVEMAD